MYLTLKEEAEIETLWDVAKIMTLPHMKFMLNFPIGVFWVKFKHEYLSRISNVLTHTTNKLNVLICVQIKRNIKKEKKEKVQHWRKSNHKCDMNHK